MAERLPTENQSPAELKRQLELERQGHSFVVLRDGRGDLAIVPLPGADELTIGRRPESGLSLEWDPEVSNVHAQLLHVGDEWLIVDDGLSRNGTYVNGQRVVGRRRLRDRDLLRCGETLILFRNPVAADRETALAPNEPARHITEAQRRVLVELCRPLSSDDAFASPATNRGIAERLFLSVASVKSHLRALFEVFDVADLPQNQKRTALAERAVRSGAVTPRDLASG